MHIYVEYTGCVECDTGCNKKNLNKKYTIVLALCVTINHFESAFNTILCMRDIVVLK